MIVCILNLYPLQLWHLNPVYLRTPYFKDCTQYIHPYKTKTTQNPKLTQNRKPKTNKKEVNNKCDVLCFSTLDFGSGSATSCT